MINFQKESEKLKIKLKALFLAYKRKDIPIFAKIIAAIAIAYALSPVDLIPDFIPVLGCVDDFLILPILIAICVKLIPKNIMKECEAQAENSQNDGAKKWYYAIPVIVIWLFVAGFVAYKIIR